MHTQRDMPSSTGASQPCQGRAETKRQADRHDYWSVLQSNITPVYSREHICLEGQDGETGATHQDRCFAENGGDKGQVGHTAPAQRDMPAYEVNDIEGMYFMICVVAYSA